MWGLAGGEGRREGGLKGNVDEYKMERVLLKEETGKSGSQGTCRTGDDERALVHAAEAHRGTAPLSLNSRAGWR